MMPKNVLGIVYSNSFDSNLDALTARRTMGSVPFGGRYRLIDFPLSNMVNCGITKVGVIANSNFRSLMDHIGSGRPWDLSRKVDGLTLLPPFTPNPVEGSRIDTLARIMDYIVHSKQEYVLLMDSNFICNLDLRKMFAFHTKNNADITLAYCNGVQPKLKNQAVLEFGGDSRVKNVAIDVKTNDPVNYLANVILVKKALLERLIGDAQSYAYTSFEKDIILKNVSSLNIYGYKVDEWNCTIDSMQTYFAANMALLNRDIRKELFNKQSPIYTKVRDDMPVIYGLSAKCNNSLVADGCLVEGTVKNSIVFRGAHVAKGAVVENSILMQDAFVGENAKLNCVIMDKNTVITSKKILSGDESYPLFVGKEIVI